MGVAVEVVRGLNRVVLAWALAFTAGCAKPSSVPEDLESKVGEAALRLSVGGGQFCSATAIDININNIEAGGGGVWVIATAYHCRELIKMYGGNVTIGNNQGEVPFPYDDYEEGMVVGDDGSDVLAFVTDAALPPGVEPLPACEGIPVGGTGTVTAGYSPQSGLRLMKGEYHGFVSGNVREKMPGGGTFSSGIGVAYYSNLSPEPGNSGGPIAIVDGEGKLCVLAVHSASPELIGLYIGAPVGPVVDKAVAGNPDGAGETKEAVPGPEPTPIAVRLGDEICLVYGSGQVVDVGDLFEQLKRLGLEPPYTLIYRDGTSVKIEGVPTVTGTLPSGLLEQVCATKQQR